MTGPGAPRRGRHASPDEGGVAPSTSWLPAAGLPAPRAPGWAAAAGAGAGDLAPARHRDGEDAWTQPRAAEPAWPATDAYEAWAVEPALAGLPGRHAGEGGSPTAPQARHRGAGDDDHPAEPRGGPAPHPSGGSHPSVPLPPMPTSAWSRLQRRPGRSGDTQAAPLLPPGGGDDHAPEWDETDGLDVLGGSPDAGEDTDVHARWTGHDEHHLEDEHHLDDLDGHDPDEHDPYEHDEDHSFLPEEDAPRDPRRTRRRRRRRGVAVVVALVVLAGLALGVVFGGRQVLGLVDSPDWTGQGTGSVSIRVHDGDSLKAIGQTMVDQGVIASVRPFVSAAEKDPDATSITPGTYALRSHMSAKAALDLLLSPAARLVSKVTVPEGLTAAVTLQKVAQVTGTPLAQLQAAAADPAAIGLPAYAGGKVEGFLFPATYDFEPHTTPADMLKAMVTRTVQSLDALAVPEQQRLQVLTEASLVQAEGKTPVDMGKIARVLDNRIAQGRPLQLDTTVNYANGKNGVTTTAADRANPSPYNTYVHPGLPPGPISNPGEDALHAVLSPTPGAWLYFVVVNPDTGDTRFAVTDQEAQANVALFQQWLREHPGR